MCTADGSRGRQCGRGERVRGYLQGSVAPCIAARGKWLVNVRRLEKAADTGWCLWVWSGRVRRGGYAAWEARCVGVWKG